MKILIFEIIIFSFICAYYIYAYINIRRHTIKMPSKFALNEKYLKQSLTFINALSQYKTSKSPIYIDCVDLENISDEAYIIFGAKAEKESLQIDKNLIILQPKKLQKKIATAYYAHKYRKVDEIDRADRLEVYDDDNPEDIFEYLRILNRIGLRAIRYRYEYYHKHSFKSYLLSHFIHKNLQITDNTLERSQQIDVKLIAELTNELKASIQIDDIFEPLYDLLVELLGNAAEHGIKKKNINWWMHRYSDINTQAMHFSFVDMGEGIIKSYKDSNLLKEKDLKSESDILLNALKGRLGSTTGKPGRGNGMPLILENIEKEWISNFFLITNSVSLRYINGTFRVLETPYFIGTYYSWSISKNNYLQWKNSLSQ